MMYFEQEFAVSWVLLLMHQSWELVNLMQMDTVAGNKRLLDNKQHY